MYWCNDCKAFHEDEMLKTVEESHGERWKVCGHCGSEDIEPANYCNCGEPKKESDDYCEWCEPAIKAKIPVIIKQHMEFTGKSRTAAIYDLISRLEDEI